MRDGSKSNEPMPLLGPNHTRHSTTLHTIFLLTFAFLTFIVAPIALVWTFIGGMRDKVSDRPSGRGEISIRI